PGSSGFESRPFGANQPQLALSRPFAILRRRGPESPAMRGESALMSRVSAAERTRLSVFLARGLLRKLVARVMAHPLLRWPFPGKTDRLVIAPQDPRTADATR